MIDDVTVDLLLKKQPEAAFKRPWFVTYRLSDNQSTLGWRILHILKLVLAKRCIFI